MTKEEEPEKPRHSRTITEILWGAVHEIRHTDREDEFKPVKNTTEDKNNMKEEEGGES